MPIEEGLTRAKEWQVLDLSSWRFLLSQEVNPECCGFPSATQSPAHHLRCIRPIIVAFTTGGNRAQSRQQSTVRSQEVSHRRRGVRSDWLPPSPCPCSRAIPPCANQDMGYKLTSHIGNTSMGFGNAVGGKGLLWYKPDRLVTHLLITWVTGYFAAGTPKDGGNPGWGEDCLLIAVGCLLCAWRATARQAHLPTSSTRTSPASAVRSRPRQSSRGVSGYGRPGPASARELTICGTSSRCPRRTWGSSSVLCRT
jgi:hypothetical protein